MSAARAGSDPAGNEDDRRPLRVVELLIVAALALVVRVGFEATLVGDDGPVGVYHRHLLGDERAYDQLARRVADGTLDRERAFYQEPLYGWLLGQLYRAVPPAPVDGTPPVIAQDRPHRLVIWWQHALGVLSALLVAWLGARCLGARVGLLAGVFAALSGPLVFHEAQILKASLSLVMFLWALHLWLDVLTEPAGTNGLSGRGLRRTLVLGAVLGVGIMLRGNMYIALGMVLLSLVARPERRQLARAAVLLTVALLSLSPLTIHNVRRGDWVLTTYQAGSNFALGQPDHGHVLSGVTYEPLRAGRGDAMFEEVDAVAIPEQALGRRLGGDEISAWWWEEARRRVSDRPIVSAKRLALKLVHLFHGNEVGDVKDWLFYRSRLGWLASPLSDLRWLGPLALLGFLFLPWRRLELNVVRAGLLVVAATLGLFYVMGRYRLSAQPCLWVLAAGAIVHGVQWFRGPARGRTKLAAGLGVAVLLSLGQYNPLGDAGFSERGWTQWLLNTETVEQTSWSNYASIERFLAEQESEPTAARAHRERAVAASRRAISLAPKYPNARQILIRSLDLTTDALGPPLPGGSDEAWRLMLIMEGYRVGRTIDDLIERDVSAIQVACSAMRSLPSIPGGDQYAGAALAFACRRVAQDLRAHSQFSLALELLDRALRFDPAETEAHLQLGWVLKKLGRLPDAEAAYRAALAGGVDNVELRNNLGNTLLGMQRYAEAVEQFERALEIAPGHPKVSSNLQRARVGAAGDG